MRVYFLKPNRSFYTSVVKVGLLLIIQLVGAQADKAPSNVLDYYNALPATLLPILKGVRDRSTLLKIKDVKNGYLRLEGAWDGYAEIALWNNRVGQNLLGINQTSCAPVCVQNIHFVRLLSGEWVDVTSKSLPKLTDQMLLDRYNKLKTKEDENYTVRDILPFIYNLPRFGTKIEVAVDEQFTERPIKLFDLIFLPEKLAFRAVASQEGRR